MKASLGRIQESKRAFRQKLANAPIAQKLRMLDQLRLRTLAIKKAASDYRKTLGQLSNKDDNLSKESAIDSDIAAKTAERFIKKNAELFKRLC